MPTDGRQRRFSVADVSRRSVLLAAGLLGSGLSTGCLTGNGEETTLQLREPDRTDKGVATLAGDQRPDQRALIEDAVANGTATVYGYLPFENIEYASQNGTYYRIQTEDTGTEVVETTVLVVTRSTDTTEAVPLDEYDGHAIELVVPLTGSDDPQTRPLYPDMNGFDQLYPGPEYEYVTREDDTYQISVGTRQREQRGRRVQIKSVASSPAEFETYLRENRLDELDPADFSRTARDIFRRALENEYREDDPYSDAFRTVLDAIQDGMPITDPADGEWLIVYDDTLYRAQIARIVHEP